MIIKTPIEHGTYKGFLRCRNLPNGACEECRLARNEYMRDFRKKNPDTYNRNLETSYIREKALRILGQRHEEELLNIIRQLRDQKRRTV